MNICASFANFQMDNSIMRKIQKYVIKLLLLFTTVVIGLIWLAPTRSEFVYYDSGHTNADDVLGCNNSGYKSPPWCQTYCWGGFTWNAPEPVIEPDCEHYNGIKFLVYVYSAPYHFEERQSSRDLYKQHFTTVDAALVFVLGLSNDEKSEKMLLNEAKIQGDILRLNFTDAYKFLGYKGIGVFNWIKKCGRNLEFLGKADDNYPQAFEEAHRFYQYLQMWDPLWYSDKILCTLPIWDNIVTEKKELSRWDVPENEFPHKKVPCPVYCQGAAGTVFSKNVALRLLEASKTTKIFRIDDAYITGFLRARSCIQLYNMNHFLNRVIFGLYNYM